MIIAWNCGKVTLSGPPALLQTAVTPSPSYVYVAGSEKSRVVTTGAWLAGAWLAGAWLDGAWLAGVWLDGAWLAGAWLDGAWLTPGVTDTLAAFLTFTFNVSFVVFLPFTVTLTVTFTLPAFFPVTLIAVFPAFFTEAILFLLLFTVSFFTCFAFTFLIVTFLLFPFVTVMDFLDSLIFFAASASADVPIRDTVKAAAITVARVFFKFLFKFHTS